MAPEDPSLLRDAQFMHNLTTGGAPTEGDIHVEVAYRFYAHDHEIARSEPVDSQLRRPGAIMRCTSSSARSCSGRLAFGNYEFSLNVDLQQRACTNPVDPKREEEFRRSMQTADRLIALYLEAATSQAALALTRRAPTDNWPTSARRRQS